MHATLSPSSAEKWLNCPASIQLEEQASSETTTSNSNIHADTGTIAHAMAELCLIYNKDAALQFVNMQENVQKYLDYVHSLQTSTSHYQIEQKIQIFDNCYGTADCVLHDQDHLHIIDLKYGKTVVSATNNKQMLLYAYGALQPHHEHITLHIVMPRGKNSTFQISRDTLIDIGTDFEKDSKAALDPDNLTMNPSSKTCQWCKAYYLCPAKTQDLVDLME